MGRPRCPWQPAFTSNPEVISRLLGAGADIEVRDDLGRTPLMDAAAFNTNPEVIATLLNAGAEVDSRDKDRVAP